jgi:hypothetical protein
MRLQFDHVFAGIARRCLEPENDPVIDGLAVDGGEPRVMRTARMQARTGDGLGDRARTRAGEAHDADAARARRGGDRGNGVALGCGHAAIVADARERQNRSPPSGGLRARDPFRDQAVATLAGSSA